MSLKLESPIIVPADDSMKKYRFLSEKLVLHDLGIVLHPLWLSLECTYPRWSKDFMSINIVNYGSYENGKGYEILIDGFYKILNCDYSKCRDIITENRLTIPVTLVFNHVLDSTLKINFSCGEKMTQNEHLKKKYYISCSDDEDMMLNTIKVKYILLVSVDYSTEIEFFDRDILEYL